MCILSPCPLVSLPPCPLVSLPYGYFSYLLLKWRQPLFPSRTYTRDTDYAKY
jgi:hypothetical protein